jgi:dephospho-CoA kinase
VRVPFVGLTGGLGAGKSAALALLERLGARTLSTDAVVHELYGLDQVRDALRERLGEEVFDDVGVDRAAVARRVFSSERDREWLEGLLWPLVAARVAAFRDESAGTRPEPLAAVVEVPLLFEAGSEGAYDVTVAIVAPDALRAARVAARDQQELGERERRQLSQEEKARRATFTLVNDGSLAELEVKLSDLLAKLHR